MDTKKLAKIIKIIIEQELKRQLPELVKEGVTKVLKENKQFVTKKPQQELVQVEQDPFMLANNMLDENRESEVQPRKQSSQLKQFTKNSVLNEILNSTKPFSKEQRVGGSPSVLDKFTPETLNENFNDMDKTVSFDTNSAQGGMDVVKSQMEAKMGYGGYSNPNGSGKTDGLGVTTGLPGLDRILNRDNSSLVKQFKTRK